MQYNVIATFFQRLDNRRDFEFEIQYFNFLNPVNSQTGI